MSGGVMAPRLAALAACLFSAALTLTVLVVASAIGGAEADGNAGCPPGTTPTVDPDYGNTICIPVSDPGSPGTTVDASQDPGDQGGAAWCTFQGQKIPCVTEHGVWFSSRQCYAQAAEPQPPADDPVWGEHAPSEGRMWYCATYQGPATGGYWFFVPDGKLPGLVDPGDVAKNALDTMTLELAEAHTAPGSNWHTFLNIDVWMWVPEGQWRTLTKTVQAGATRVRVTAEPVRVTWDMGPGQVDCAGPGRPWASGMGATETSNCTYRYTVLENPEGDSHEVFARIAYAVDWVCTGACSQTTGELGEVIAPPGSTTTVDVLQRQTVVVE